jgi:DNA polymerase-3 subunit gamma/tau
MQLHEQYRPKTWADVVAQKDVLKQIDILRNRGLSGRAYWLSGLSGTGKTTIAYLIASEVAEPWAIEEIDSKELTAAMVREYERKSAGRLLGGSGGMAFIVNEAHGLTRTVITQLLTTLERIPAHVVWIFTTTVAGQLSLFDEQMDARPLLSRCQQIRLSTDRLELDFAIRARKIAEAEQLDGKPITAYVNLVRECKYNLREVLQRIECGVMLG